MNSFSKLKKSILFILPTYDPLNNMRGLSVRKVAKQLTINNVNVQCITFKENSASLSYELNEGVKIHRVNQRFLVRLINDSSNSLEGLKFKTGIFLSRIQGLIMAPFWPLLSIFEIFRLYNTAEQKHLKENFSCVIGCYKRVETLLAALFLKKKYPEIKFIAYTLDCMSRSLVPKILNTNIALHSVKRWERFIFSKADYICIMQSHQNHYKQEEYKRFESKFVIMDIPLFELNDTNPNVDLNKKGEKINLVFTGSMSESTADPSYFIKILESVDDMVFEFNIYGGTSSVTISNNIKNSYLYGKKIFWHGVVSPEKAAQKQKEADILISFGNDNECMIPSKIFEYIALKKHVMHFYKSLTDSALPYFEKYGNATLIQEEQKISSDVSQKVMDLLMNIPDVKIDNDLLLEKFYNNTAEPMADFIISLLKK
ncbi:glycosyltransferase family protein [Chryseobacterium salivictor]|uniref:Uncharacterized protein n=1 Tax=Chryseobacterium salivictor TaxID=2547600 RepID=A0A4P6ZJ81_9FLAO|nr:hypothetical protein [Chryseobacterium salivictor]QBO59682.1 hypothetical protein NBC122_02882 [Chryseobacterium salivictor]